MRSELAQPLFAHTEMIQLKKHIAYTFLGVFVVTAIIATLGALGIIPIPVTPLVSIFAFLVTQCIAVIAAIIKAPNYFEDPPAVAKLKEQQDAAIARLGDAYSQLRQVDHQTIGSHAKTIAGLAASSTAKDAEIARLKSEIYRLKPAKPIPPIASGSARTRTTNVLSTGMALPSMHCA